MPPRAIHERHLYTSIGTSGLVALNPHKYVASNADSTLPPHIFQLANNSYYHMRRTGQDQCVLFSGETGSGKSENRRLSIKTLLELSVSNPGKKGSKLATQVPAAEFYTELQFTDRGRLCGVKTLDYYLERNRVAAVPNGERNFHIFYYLPHLHLGDKTTYRGVNAPRDDDAHRFDQLKVALKTIGFSKRHVAQTCQLFTVDRHRNEDAAVVRNTDVLEVVADSLGCRLRPLRMLIKELCTGDLAKTLYALLFAWINEHINQRLCKDDFTTFIGLFDLPGPQNMTLHHFIQKRMFESHVSEYTAEGIARFVPQVPYFDNAECVRLIQNTPGGLIHIMDDQARRMPKKSDLTMIEAFQKRWGNHSSFKSGGMDRSGFPTFTINHYNGGVTYSAENFLEKNLDAVNPDFVSLLRGALDGAPGHEGGGSINPKAIATQAHPRNEDTIVSAQQVAKPCNTIKRLPTLKETGEDEKERDIEDGDGPTSSGSPCIGGEFRAALDTLFETLDETQPWFVFCINPNDSQLPNQLEGRSVKGQVRSIGLSEIARRNVNVFEVGMLPAEFCDRYKEGLEGAGVVEGNDRERVEQARTAFGLEDRDVVLGQHKVFLSQLAFHRFEDQLRSRDVEEQKRNRMREAEAEAGLDPRGLADPYAPYRSPGEDDLSPFAAGYSDAFNSSNQALPLVANASPFQRAGLYDEDGYDEHKSLKSEEFDGRSRFTSQRDDTESNFGSESYAPSRNMFQGADKRGLTLDKEALPGEVQEGETAEVLKESSARRKWVALCWILTWWVPTPFLTYIGRMKRMDVRQAWREKLALNMIIWFMCACAVFVIAILGVVICPTEHVFNSAELASHSVQLSPNNVLVSIRGEVFDLTTVAQTHAQFVSVVPTKSILNYGGQNADNIFPVQVSALCNGITGTVSPYVILDSKNNTDPNAQYHDFRVFTNDSRPDWYFESMVQMRYSARVGFVGYTPKAIKSMADSSGSSVAIYNGLVYDLTTYLTSPPAIRSPTGTQAPSNIDVNFMHGSVLDLFKLHAGKDITKDLNNLNIDRDTLERQKVCLRNLFLIGRVDNRQSPQCLFANYILLVLSIIMVAIIGFKFLASINFGASRAPEDHDKFLICQVPCYTEGTESLRKTIDSLAQLKYDDKRKLLVVICDGMIVGSGNDRPTPRIVLDILGADPNLDPEPLSFVSLGEGAKQHNMGKVYSGLYECSGHVVPYMVVVKVGKPTERNRPGNRGKRDSQLLLMQFLNRVHFNSPMNPLELEMYHQIKNVIGVNPTFYEYLFMVDADTTVDPLSANRLISAMVHDKKLLGVCGETELANAKQSIITMMQVYEYFISHHMAKAFESLFGSVTCLPGCFTLYRLRTPDTHKPLLISNQLIQDYSENRVDTLHMKNLLHLGEDRYLTTLLLKHFPNFKTQFVRDAHAYTVAPDDWKVLLSQRRRWINSTVHNLGELVFLEQLCGFCCFSMRFVVMVDLLSTLTQPVTVAYIVYLVYLVVGQGKSIPTLSLIMIAAIYGVQALVFVFRRKWDMIGWMVFYVIAIPVFSFFLPLYSFWKMDDFSWGATRVVLGEAGKKMIVHDEGKFDPRSIPLKSWNDYENELWDKESNHSIGSWVPPPKKEGYAESHTASIYGRETFYDPHPRSFSPAPSQFGMYPPAYPPAPGYHSGRNTPQSPFNNPTQETNLLHQPAPSRPVTNYLDIPIPGSGSPEEYNLSSGSPSDADLERGVQDILRQADLNTVTKREIRRQMEERFGMDLTSRKSTINASIDRILLSQA
ncbi:glycosyltransferase family 2 protein [Cyathus striatus]|nr:glycosyltransferase family 2 protein [Cyathus striatus]